MADTLTVTRKSLVQSVQSALSAQQRLTDSMADVAGRAADSIVPAGNAAASR